MSYPGWPYEGGTKADEVADRLNRGDCAHRTLGTSVCVECVREVLADALEKRT